MHHTIIGLGIAAVPLTVVLILFREHCLDYRNLREAQKRVESREIEWNPER